MTNEPTEMSLFSLYVVMYIPVMYCCGTEFDISERTLRIRVKMPFP